VSAAWGCRAIPSEDEDDDSLDWGRYEYAWEFRGVDNDNFRRASLGGAGGATRPSLDLLHREFVKVQARSSSIMAPPSRESTKPAAAAVGVDAGQLGVADGQEEGRLDEFENDPEAQWVMDGLDPFAM